MKVGLFICDHIDGQYRNEFGDYNGMFSALFPEFTFQIYDVINNEFPKDLDACKVYMISGSRHSVYDDLPWINKLKTITQKLNAQQKCLIGICFGHQLIGEALGGEVKKSENGWCVGVHEFDIKEEQAWMKPGRSTLNLLMMCQDQVLSLPPETKVLAGNDICPNAIIQVGDNILGIQAHPEFSKNYDKLLMENRVGRMGADTVDKGIESLHKAVHTTIIHDWIINFIENRI